MTNDSSNSINKKDNHNNQSLPSIYSTGYNANSLADTPLFYSRQQNINEPIPNRNSGSNNTPNVIIPPLRPPFTQPPPPPPQQQQQQQLASSIPFPPHHSLMSLPPPITSAMNSYGTPPSRISNNHSTSNSSMGHSSFGDLIGYPKFYSVGQNNGYLHQTQTYFPSEQPQPQPQPQPHSYSLGQNNHYIQPLHQIPLSPQHPQSPKQPKQPKQQKQVSLQNEQLPSYTPFESIRPSQQQQLHPLNHDCTNNGTNHNQYNQYSQPNNATNENSDRARKDKFSSQLYHMGNHSASNVQYVRQFLHHLNPSYAVNLKFSKDLNTMTRDWTEQEIHDRRRLVEFIFTDSIDSGLSDSSLNAMQTIDFNVIHPSEYDTSKAVVSCIYWRETNKFICTSVDIISLLEYLVRQSFGIEEKNRIRRNLQSLKPKTVSRSSRDDQEFFSLIMGMENPRPRNIEKDLKVFNWSDLSKAITKVMSKYYVVSSPTQHHLPQLQVLHNHSDNTSRVWSPPTNGNVQIANLTSASEGFGYRNSHAEFRNINENPQGNNTRFPMHTLTGNVNTNANTSANRKLHEHEHDYEQRSGTGGEYHDSEGYVSGSGDASGADESYVPYERLRRLKQEHPSRFASVPSPGIPGQQETRLAFTLPEGTQYRNQSDDFTNTNGNNERLTFSNLYANNHQPGLALPPLRSAIPYDAYSSTGSMRDTPISLSEPTHSSSKSSSTPTNSEQTSTSQFSHHSSNDSSSNHGDGNFNQSHALSARANSSKALQTQSRYHPDNNKNSTLNQHSEESSKSPSPRKANRNGIRKGNRSNGGKSKNTNLGYERGSSNEDVSSATSGESSSGDQSLSSGGIRGGSNSSGFGSSSFSGNSGSDSSSKDSMLSLQKDSGDSSHNSSRSNSSNHINGKLFAPKLETPIKDKVNTNTNGNANVYTKSNSRNNASKSQIHELINNSSNSSASEYALEEGGNEDEDVSMDSELEDCGSWRQHEEYMDVDQDGEGRNSKDNYKLKKKKMHKKKLHHNPHHSSSTQSTNYFDDAGKLPVDGHNVNDSKTFAAAPQTYYNKLQSPKLPSISQLLTSDFESRDSSVPPVLCDDNVPKEKLPSISKVQKWKDY